jgi:Uncharacterized protein conserved in bacteria (DUF2320).
MNKIVASIGIAAVGASALQNACAQDMGNPNKPWSVTATLRGFYDDNLNTTSSDRLETFGLEIAPGLGLEWSNDQTTLSAGYRFSGKVYENVSGRFADKWDKTHEFRLALDHAFNERYRLGLSDSFVIGQEPDRLRNENSASAAPIHISGDNIRNYASIYFNAELTPTFGVEVGYNNSFFDYDAEFDSDIQPFGGISPSNSGLLDRVEHTGYLEGQFRVRPTTQVLAGYQFGVVDYTGDEFIRGFWDGSEINNGAKSDVRNSRSHYGYVGVNHTFTPELSGSIRGGIQYIDFYNEEGNADGVSPYVQAVLNYFYAPESFVRVGFTQRRSPIFIASAQDADTSVVFGSVTHRITPFLFATFSGTFQNSIYNADSDSGIDGKTQQFYQLGLNLEYRISRYLSAEAGYNFDSLNSDVGDRDYDRNRVYIGLIARY